MTRLRIYRLSQPPSHAGIDTSSALAAGLAGYINPAARDYKVVGPASVMASPAGLAIAGNGSSLAYKDVPAFTNAATILFVGNWLTGGQHIVSIGTSGAGDQCFILQAGQGGSSQPRALIRTVQGGGVTTAEAVGAGNDTEYPNIEVWCARYDGTTNLRLFRNGLDYTGSNKNTGASGAMSSLNNVGLGGTNRGSDAFAKPGQIGVLGLYWRRALSDEEIRRVSTNPWQLFRPVQRRVYFDMGAGGGTTAQVSNDLPGEYAIRSAVQSDSSGAYAVLGAVQADAASAYTVLGAVSADAAAEYTIRASAQSDVSAEYAIRSSVQADSSAAYAIRSSVQADAGAAFFVRDAVLSDAAASYVVRTNASADLSAAYEIQTASGVGASLDASYNVRASVQSDASAAYDLRTAVGATSEHAFMVRGLVSSDLDASFTVEAAITQVYADLQAAYLVDGGAVFIPSQFGASVPAGVFSARAPAGEYSATVPAGNYRASI